MASMIQTQSATRDDARRQQAKAEKMFAVLSEGWEEEGVHDVNMRLNGIDALIEDGHYGYAIEALEAVFKRLNTWNKGQYEAIEAREIALDLMMSFAHRKKDIKERFPLLVASVGIPGYTAEVLLNGAEALTLALDLKYESELLPLNCRSSK